MTRLLVDVAVQRGYVTSGEIQRLPPPEVAKMLPFGAFAWGSHAVFRAERIRKLGWEPQHPNVFASLEETLVHQALLLEKGVEVKTKLSHGRNK